MATTHKESISINERLNIPEQIKRFGLDPDILTRHELNKLPEGVAIIGGAARAIAWEQLFGEKRAVIRDIDLVGFSELNPDESLYRDLSIHYMPDDAAYGHGVETTSLSDYFSSRDFTINEVTVVNNEIMLTSQCLEDLRDFKIRFSDSQIGVHGGVNYKLYLKAELMECVFQEFFGKGEFMREGLYHYNSSDFDFALALNKAFQYGKGVPRRFLSRYSNGAPLNPQDILDMAATISRDIGFKFRGSDFAESVNAAIPLLDSQTPVGDEASLFDYLCRDLPVTQDSPNERAIELMNKYSGHLPKGSDGYV